MTADEYRASISHLGRRELIALTCELHWGASLAFAAYDYATGVDLATKYMIAQRLLDPMLEEAGI